MNTSSSLCLTFFCLLNYLSLTAQEGIQLNTADAYQKYLLYHSNGDTYLVDNCGKKVQQWNNQPFPQFHPKLTKNGDVIFLTGNTIHRVDWNGNEEIIYQNTDNDFLFEYEVIEMNNGNYLCIGRRFFTEELREALDFNLFSGRYDVIVEIDPTQNKVVWEWKSIDHTIQNRDNSKSNFGDVSNHPELLDVNSLSYFDWDTEAFMINGFDYNEDLDQIVVSLRRMSEIAIIDHSTTTNQAAGHTGGQSGKGGDILYRWGNPNNYDRGSTSDRELYFQHNPNWIKNGVYKDQIILFNNGLARPIEEYTSIDIIQPSIDSTNNYFTDSTGEYGPHELSWRYVDTVSNSNMFAAYTGAAHVLPNSNVLISLWSTNEVIEVTPAKEKVWNYFLPQATFLFRTEAYGANFSGFANRELIPGVTVEDPPSNYNCMLFSSTEELNGVDQKLTIRLLGDYIEFSLDFPSDMEIHIYDMKGSKIISLTGTGLATSINTAKLPGGVYIATLTTKRETVSKKIYIAQ